MDDGTVKLWDPATTSPALLSQATGSASAPVDALTFTDRIDGTLGVPDLVAVSSRGNSAQVLRYSGATTLAPLPVTAGGGTTTDVGGIRAWFPGYKTGYLQLYNNPRNDSAIQIDFATRPNASYGCWFSQDFDGYPALPTSSVIIEKGTTSAVYSTAALTAGEGGDCASTDFTGQWAAYMVVTPLSRPADRTVAKLVWSRSGDLTVQSVGGSNNLTFQHDTDTSLLGSAFMMISTSPPPAAPTSLKLTGTRLDPAGTDAPVYRFDVAATTWPLPVSSPPRIQTVLPPLRVFGVHGQRRLYDTRPAGPAGTTEPSHLRLGHLVPGQLLLAEPDYRTTDRRLYVDVGEDTIESTGIVSGRVSPPRPPGPRSARSGCARPPAPPRVTAPPTRSPTAWTRRSCASRSSTRNSQVLPLTDPVYSQVYYRDENGDLLTGLIPEDGSAYTRVSPYAGAYPNDGSTPSTTRPPTNGTVGGRFGYLSTTTTDEQELTAHVAGSQLASQPILVEGVDFTPQVQAGAQAGPGFYVTGCRDYSSTNFCRLAQVTSTKPGLFLTSDPDTGELRIGLQFQTTAQTSLTSLPLQQVAGQPEHLVAARPLTVNNGEVHLNTTSGFQPADAIDTWLVSHGTQIEIRDVRVGGGN